MTEKLRAFSHTELSGPGWANVEHVAALIEFGHDPAGRPDVTLVKQAPVGPVWLLAEGVDRWPWLLDPLAAP